MLVLTRKLDEQIQIGPHITVTVLKIKGNTIRLGIQAPRDVAVLRSELSERGDFQSDEPTVEAARQSRRREQLRTVDSLAGLPADDRSLPSAIVVRRPSLHTGLGSRMGARGGRRLMAGQAVTTSS